MRARELLAGCHVRVELLSLLNILALLLASPLAGTAMAVVSRFRGRISAGGELR